MNAPPRLILLPTLGVLWSTVALLLPGVTTDSQAYEVVTRYTGDGDRNLTWLFLLLLVVHVVALLSVRARPWALGLALMGNGTFAVAIATARPSAIVPGYALAAAACCAYALADSLRVHAWPVDDGG